MRIHERRTSMENIQYAFITKDGVQHPFNAQGAANVFDATFELASSIMHGDITVEPDNVVAIMDIPG